MQAEAAKRIQSRSAFSMEESYFKQKLEGYHGSLASKWLGTFKVEKSLENEVFSMKTTPPTEPKVQLQLH